VRIENKKRKELAIRVYCVNECIYGFALTVRNIRPKRIINNQKKGSQRPRSMHIREVNPKDRKPVIRKYRKAKKAVARRHKWKPINNG